MGGRRSELTSTVVLALGSVYIIWSSTYLAQRIALERFPPFLLGGVRYMLAGAVLFALLRMRGAPAPSAREWRASALVGALLLMGGNGLVAYAQQYLASGVAAVVVATVPLWAVLFSALWGSRPSRPEILGLLLGLGGVVLLKRGGAFEASLLGFLALLLGPVSWALGSVWSARLPLPKGPMASAAQMLCGGLFSTTLGLPRGERVTSFASAHVAAFLYLVVFGSLVAFRAYGYLLAHTRPALATSYAFVNPTLALLLGAAVAGEPLAASSLLACALTVAGVLVVVLGRTR
jgi:drug/metabolite transporter (DMT)-like permease